MLYATETLALKKKDLERLGVTQRKMMRRMVDTMILDTRGNDWLRQMMPVEDIRGRAVMRKWNWAREIAGMPNDRWTKKALQWTPLTYRRERGRPKARWRDEFVGCLSTTNWSTTARSDPLAWQSALAGRIHDAKSG